MPTHCHRMPQRNRRSRNRAALWRQATVPPRTSAAPLATAVAEAMASYVAVAEQAAEAGHRTRSGGVGHGPGPSRPVRRLDRYAAHLFRPWRRRGQRGRQAERPVPAPGHRQTQFGLCRQSDEHRPWPANHAGPHRAAARTSPIPREWSSLPKACLCLAGLAGEAPSGDLRPLLQRFGGGVDLTIFSALPKGSGLGASSILGATVLACLARMTGETLSPEELIARTSLLEQRMTTSGGWQDQVGGVFPGVKLIRTEPGREQIPAIFWLAFHEEQAKVPAAAVLHRPETAGEKHPATRRSSLPGARSGCTRRADPAQNGSAASCATPSTRATSPASAAAYKPIGS